MYIFERKINYYETDKMGVVHHSNYIRFLEEARSRWMESFNLSMEKLEKQIQASIRSETGLRVDVTLCEPESLPRSEGKAIRVIDERNL